MSLLARYLTDAHRAELSERVTANGMRLEDVVRSGLRQPDSAIGVYAPDAESYAVFHELFDPMLAGFQAPDLTHGTGLACLNPAAIVSTRIRMARNLAGRMFTAGMPQAERLAVEQEIALACRALAPRFPGATLQLRDIPAPKLAAMVSGRQAFGPDDKYMAAAGIHAGWPLGRSVFNSDDHQLSVWINEEDHLRVAVVLPGANVSACHDLISQAMSMLAARLDFCADARLGYLTSCPSNVGSAMRASYRVDLRADPSQEALLQELEVAGLIDIRSVEGEHAPRTGGLVDTGFRKRVGISETQMLRAMTMLLKTPGADA